MRKCIKKILTVALCGALLLPLMPQYNIHTASAETIAENAIYVAPNATGSGSVSDPMNLVQAIATVAPGQTIYLLEGTYEFSDTITIAESNSGTEGQYKTLSAYPGAEGVLDFSK